MSESARPFPSSPPVPPAAAPVGQSPAASVLVAAAVCRDPASSVQPLPLDSRQLLQGRRDLQILHQGEIYRLQQTRQGKLILTK